MIKKPFVVALEGGECCGKTTLAKYLKQNIESLGYSVFLAHEPGSTPIGEEIRNILLNPQLTMCDTTEALLFAAARSEFVNMIKHLKDYDVVITDRCLSSSVVYQGLVRDLDPNKILAINDFAIKKWRPNLEVFLIPNLEVAAQRLKNKQHDRMENEPWSFHQKVYSGFDEYSTQRLKEVKGDTQHYCMKIVGKEDDANFPQQYYSIILAVINVLISTDLELE